MSHARPDADIYRLLGEHQVSAAWDFQELMHELHRWAGILISGFKLKIPRFAIRIDHLPARRLGHYVYGCNGFGLEGEIAINRRYLHQRPFWEVVGTLCHELLHGWQELHGKTGKNNYHNVQFRRKAGELGLVVDQYGHTAYAPDSPFVAILAEHGLVVPALPELQYRVPGTSKLKLWICPCRTRARVAVADFQARCLKCGGLFEFAN